MVLTMDAKRMVRVVLIAQRLAPTEIPLTRNRQRYEASEEIDRRTRADTLQTSKIEP